MGKEFTYPIGIPNYYDCFTLIEMLYLESIPTSK